MMIKTITSKDDITPFVKKILSVRKKPIIVKAGELKNDCYIKTLEGKMFAKAGSYLIVGVKGEVYPCEKVIFEETYDVVH